MFFIWENNFACRPVPHIAQERPMDHAKGKPKPILAIHELTDEEAKLPFSVLEKMFPLK